jgi:hypothetical protein
MKKVFLALAIALVLPVASFAQSAAPVASPAPVAASAPAATASPAVQASPASPAVVTDIQNVVNKIPSSLPAWILAALAILGELCMRFFPTKDPKSLFIVAGNVCGLLGSGFMKISQLLDSVVQNLSSPTAAVENGAVAAASAVAPGAVAEAEKVISDLTGKAS